MGFFLGSQARVRNSHGKRAISVRAIEVLLYRFNQRQKTSLAAAMRTAISHVGGHRPSHNITNNISVQPKQSYPQNRSTY